MSLVTGGRGDTYAARTAVAVVGHCDEWSSRCSGRLRVRVRELRASKQASCLSVCLGAWDKDGKTYSAVDT